MRYSLLSFMLCTGMLACALGVYVRWEPWGLARNLPFPSNRFTHQLPCAFDWICVTRSNGDFNVDACIREVGEVLTRDKQGRCTFLYCGCTYLFFWPAVADNAHRFAPSVFEIVAHGDPTPAMCDKESISTDGKIKALGICGVDPAIKIFRFRHPDAWYGVAWFPEAWVFAGLGLAAAWTTLRRREPVAAFLN